ncbi:MICOS complex subunit MIC19 isoform X8 [Coregonus clupeaformis]|uniref:MICOS complex subunit MIC19 isoform X8 n=1 Tax=Coregonus clupeaformis TaxID=59861 RepID=UPI001BE0FDBD|nr:MICOS complex subunit MIC19 isoform X8 [Coregonus clupeaformis]
MGANNSTRRVSFESDENDNITVVKGIRLPVEVVAPPPPAPEPEPVAAAPPPPSPPAVDEEELRKKITEDLQKGLLKERAKAEQELQAWLEEEKVHAASFAEAEAQASLKDEVGRILELERATTHNTLTQAVMRERVSAEDERLRAQLYEITWKAKQLELRDQELKKQDAFYREQVARLEDRSAQFYKVTTENYHKAADGINAKFKRFEVSPVCADLQGQILKCYQEHTGKTLLCSTIASRYLQCVNQAKQNCNNDHAPLCATATDIIKTS